MLAPHNYTVTWSGEVNNANHEGRRTIQVWAPDANTLQIEWQRSRVLQRGPEGGWSTCLPELAHGDRYGFIINRCEPVLPDPRSGWQPDGVHGYSAFVDHSAFEWTDEGWQPRPLSSAVMYELHVGTFSPAGTFDGAIERLDHLVWLKVTHIELMAVAQFSGEWGWGYDGVDLYAPHSAYGGPDALKRLCNECHARGLAVILDVVYNHLGLRAITSAGSRHIRPAATPLLGATQPRRAAQPQCPAVLYSERSHVASRLPYRRSSCRRGPCISRQQRLSFSGRAHVSRSCALGRAWALPCGDR
jgi:1,4-alpha-glucan branching enzyme